MSILPNAETPAKPTSVRLTVELLDRIDAAAKRTGHNRSETIAILVRHALELYEASAATDKKRSSS